MNNKFPRPKLLVSRCLGFAACRYDGQQLSAAIIELLRDHVDFMDHCPEMEAGLGVPRAPIRLCRQEERLEVWQQAHARLVTSDLEKAAHRLSSTIADCDGAILKAKSPSCGLRDAKIYQGIENPHFLQWGSGIFGSMVLTKLGHKAVEDEQRLTNLALREHFLIKLYVWARFRTMEAKPQMKELVTFHAEHKLLFLAYNQSRFRLCGKIVANHERVAVTEVFHRYQKELRQILNRPFQRQAMVNTLYHAFGWISKQLTSPEREYIINTMEEYRDERIPLQAVTRLIEAQALRFEQKYLLDQVLLRPFPAPLSDLSDTGKGREMR